DTVRELRRPPAGRVRLPGMRSRARRSPLAAIMIEDGAREPAIGCRVEPFLDQAAPLRDAEPGRASRRACGTCGADPARRSGPPATQRFAYQASHPPGDLAQHQGTCRQLRYW